MMDSVFREYDIRGKVGSELVVDQVYDLVRAIAFYIVEKAPQATTIAVGMDGRTHSPVIKQEVCRALQESGLDVLFVGVCPSPVLYYSLHTQPVDAGIMITASHNTKEYNGFKLCLGAKSVWGDQIRAIQQYYHDKKCIIPDVGGVYKEIDVISDYCAWFKKHFPHLVGMQLPVVIDCGNGAAGTVLPRLINEMEWTHVQLLYEEVDGNYPHHEADPTKEKNMLDARDMLYKTKSALAIGLDGDCDRMGAMTAEGFLVPGDQLLAVFAASMIKQHPNLGVVTEVKASQGLSQVLERIGAQLYFSACGHAIIKTMMDKYQALLGGELSCHFFFVDRHMGYDDGIYAAFRLLELVQTTGKSLTELLTLFPKKCSSPEYRIVCEDERKFVIVRRVKEYFCNQPGIECITIDGVRVQTKDGWGLVRASNTQPALSMRFESDTQDGLNKIKEMFCNVLAADFDKELLSKELGMESSCETNRLTC